MIFLYLIELASRKRIVLLGNIHIDLMRNSVVHWIHLENIGEGKLYSWSSRKVYASRIEHSYTMLVWIRALVEVLLPTLNSTNGIFSQSLI